MSIQHKREVVQTNWHLTNPRYTFTAGHERRGDSCIRVRVCARARSTADMCKSVITKQGNCYSFSHKNSKPAATHRCFVRATAAYFLSLDWTAIHIGYVVIESHHSSLERCQKMSMVQVRIEQEDWSLLESLCLDLSFQLFTWHFITHCFSTVKSDKVLIQLQLLHL